MAKSIPDRSSKSSQQTLWDSGGCISSAELPCGIMPSTLQDGGTANAGPEAAPALPLAQRAKGKGLQTLVTSGRNGFGSSASAALQSSLESRLLPRLDTAGSTLFVEIWKRKATPLRRRYWEHTARARPTSGKGCTSVPTPNSYEPEGGGSVTVAERKAAGLNRPSGAAYASQLRHTTMLASVPTPQTHDDRLRGNTEADCHYYPHDLSNAAVLASVPTPMAIHPGTDNYNPSSSSDYSRRVEMLAGARETVNGPYLSAVPTPNSMEGGQTSRSGSRKGELLIGGIAQLATVATPRRDDSESTGAHRGKPDTLHSQTVLASVPTPRVGTNNGYLNPERALDPGNCRLEDTAQLVSVTSPTARDRKDTSGMSEGGVDPDGSTRSRLDQLPRQAQLADSGPTATGGTGATASSGQLDPAYSRWLMGLPAEWCDCAVTAMASLQKQRKSSLKATQQSGERPKGEA